MKINMFPLLAGLMFFIAEPRVHAQTMTPLCPDDQSVTFRFNQSLPPGPAPGNYTLVNVRKAFAVPIFGIRTFEYFAENIQGTGNQISFDARGVEIYPVGIPPPAHFDSLGVLNAGSYTVTIHPIATNVTPNVACPTLTVLLVIPQAYEYVPLPGPTGYIAAILAALLGIFGISVLARRKVVR